MPYNFWTKFGISGHCATLTSYSTFLLSSQFVAHINIFGVLESSANNVIGYWDLIFYFILIRFWMLQFVYICEPD